MVSALAMKPPGFSEADLKAFLPIDTLPKKEPLLTGPLFKRYQIDHKARAKEIAEKRDIEFTNQWKVLKKQYKGLDPKEVFNRRKSLTREICNRVTASVYDLHSKRLAGCILWDQSEHTLKILRTRGSRSPQDNQSFSEARSSFWRRIDLEEFPEVGRGTSQALETQPWGFTDSSGKPDALHPNVFFANTRRTLVEEFGYPFYSTVPYGPPSDSAEQIIDINTDFWAAYIGGDKRLQHDLVYYVPEQTFYFYDPLSECYVPTNEQKVRVWLGLSLQERAWGQPEKTASMILMQFREKPVFDEIIAKAKALHEAGYSFFNGPGAQARWGDRQSELAAHRGKHAVASFVAAHISSSDDHVLPVADGLKELARWYEANEQVMPPYGEMKQQFEREILKAHGKTVRNDVKSPQGASCRGWKGLQLRVPKAELAERVTTDLASVASVASELSDPSAAIISTHRPE